MSENLPDFICIGAQRAGTTWLYQCLKEHPAVFVPEKKEVRFFNYQYSEGLDWYRSHFEGHQPGQILGELTPDYHRQAEAIDRIAKDVPGVKLVYVLRDPVARAYSQYSLYLETEYRGLTFHDACNVKRHELVDWGQYGKHLSHVLSHFPEDQIKILLYDELKADPLLFLRTLFEFLEVDRDFVPSIVDKKVNRAVFPRAQSVIRNAGLGAMIDVVSRTPVGNWLKKRHYQRGSQVPESDARQLAHEFAPDLEQLSEIVGRDFSFWLKPYI